MKSAALFLAAAAVVSGNQIRQSGDRILRIEIPNNLNDLSASQRVATQDLLNEEDVWGTTPAGELEVRVSADKVQAFEKLGLKFTDSTAYHTKHMDDMARNIDSQMCRGDAVECARADDFYDNYQGVEAIHARFADYESKFAHVTRKDWGETFEGRTQRGVRITSDASTTKPAVFYFCGEHAREWIPPMFCTYMAETIAEKYEEGDADVVRLMDSVEFHILPVMNVDGYVFTMEDIPWNMMWRKSRKPNPNSGCLGTDLNRNYASHWNEGGSSSNPCSDTFHGASPFDNVETANMERYAAETNILIQTDVHAYGQMWMHPYGWTSRNGGRPNNSTEYTWMNEGGKATADAIRDVSGLTFRYGPISEVIYVASGSSCDHFYDAHGVVYAYAPEVRGSSFHPDASNIKPSNEELWAGMMAQVEYAVNQMNGGEATATWKKN